MDAVSLDFADLKIGNVADSLPGSIVWNWSNRSGEIHSYLRVASADGNPSAFLLSLSGAEKFRVSIFAPTYVRPVVEVERGPMRLDFNKANVSVGSPNEIGCLALTVDGPFICAEISQNGFLDPCFVSMRDWTISSSINTSGLLGIRSWSLVKRASGRDDTIIFSHA